MTKKTEKKKEKNDASGKPGASRVQRAQSVNLTDVLQERGMSEEGVLALRSVLDELDTIVQQIQAVQDSLNEIPEYRVLAERLRSLETHKKECEGILKPLLQMYEDLAGAHGSLVVTVSTTTKNIVVNDAAVETMAESPEVKYLRSLPERIFKERIDPDALWAAYEAGIVDLDQLIRAGLLGVTSRDPAVSFKPAAKAARRS